VQAGLTAFSGNACDGSVGNNVPCDGSCHSFDGRHSLVIDGDSSTHCVTMWEVAGCPSAPTGSDPLRIHTFEIPSTQCTNINTGTPIESFNCSPNPNCII
ncbi:hypothetical protein C8Q74DRAFT_1166719, partial [Fomes fomentarius]